GLKVRPFKPQNMSNNAAVTDDGGEIGRAQALQALAAKCPLSVHMNPILLKPQSDEGSQIIVQGRVYGHAAARDYQKLKQTLLTAVLESYEHIREKADLVLVEGAGSPAEINLREGDIANMGFARATNTPVVLIGDVDRGGVIASLVGTHSILSPEDRHMIAGFIINKFRGDVSLFDDGLTEIVNRTRWQSFGICPWFEHAHALPAEDSVGLERPQTTTSGSIKIAIPVISRIANFDDFDPLIAEPDVELVMVKPGTALPGDAALIILPGSKSTIGDMEFLRKQGWDIDIHAHVRRGNHVLGICGGYQMLGNQIFDPEQIEGARTQANGLGLLDIETTLERQKTLRNITATSVAFGTAITGYEIHMGQTKGPDTTSPMLTINKKPDGATSPNGLVSGCYMHGLFTSDNFRRSFLNALGASLENSPDYNKSIDDTLDTLSNHLETHLDVDALFAISPDYGSVT
ncbi:MAG: cobyric acid synthase, partial [Roseicyclus sp.]|nr:cobyric acid synthase [Roseicyclus sp.]